MDDQPLEDVRREPRKPQEAADIAVGQALVGGEVGERGDVAAFQPLPPAPSVYALRPRCIRPAVPSIGQQFPQPVQRMDSTPVPCPK